MTFHISGQRVIMTRDALLNIDSEEPMTVPARTNGPMKIRTLIADDQLLARELLRRMLRDEPDIEIVAMPTSGRETVDAINLLAPDLVFLDVQMPELDGFAVLKKITLERMPVIVFVTANDDFARRAFDVHALDYLVKPCSLVRFQTTLQRARDQIEPNQTDRIAVKSGGRIVFLRLSEVDWVEAADNYVKLHVGNDSHLLRNTMNA